VSKAPARSSIARCLEKLVVSAARDAPRSFPAACYAVDRTFGTPRRRVFALFKSRVGT
jgi:hypothetical protein